MVDKTGQMGVPVITVDDTIVIGFDRNRLEELLTNYKSQKPHFGLRVADADKVASNFGLIPVPGVLIGSVAADSLGARAGLLEKDIIVEVNAHAVKSAEDLQNLLSDVASGDRLSITFLRGTERRQTVLLV
jgi:serine protease Do